MRKVFLSILATICVSTVAWAALAADAPVARKAPPAVSQAVAFDWTGLYAGAHFGAAFAHYETGNLSIYGSPTPLNLGEFNASGAILGLHVGYQRHLLPNIVIGVEADWQKARVDGTRTVLAILDVRSALDHYATARAKIGVTHGPVMVYATGGYAWGRTETDVSLLGLANASADVSRKGWTYGAGVDLMATPNFIIGLQYKHIDLGDKTLTFGPVSVVSDLKVDEVTLRASYRF